ncbi:MFS-type efflux pump MFS1 [Pseudocercospora fuligena]|uniref:MFS-type efflux pump MFS1 n=1 Tax=Pseudocercospora fuligena TaxID=685502 RepID=A0A8H6VTB2_9PEZI|nr:MFS-type efflux pump MFS1 [Pseudocercospora fuligena]
MSTPSSSWSKTQQSSTTAFDSDIALQSVTKDSEKATETVTDTKPNRSSFEHDDEPQYPTGLRLVFIVVALFASMFLVAISQTVLAAAIPTITDVFDSYNDIGWYSTGEQLTAVSLQLPFGRAYSLLNNKWTYVASMVIFMVGSAICGAAPSSIPLIFGRTIQGVGCAGVFGGTFILIARFTPLRKRALFAGLVGAAYAVASVLGPIIGGVFTTNASWRWCFYFNLPIGAVAILVVILCLPSSLARTSDEFKSLNWWQTILRFDPFGTSLLLSSLVCLMLALQRGGADYAWSDGRVIAVLVVFGLTIVPWLVLQRFQGDDATIPFSILRQRTVWSSSLYLLFVSASFGVLIFFVPVWFQSISGDSAEASGLKQLALCISTAVSSIVAGGIVVAIGYYNPFVILGPFFMVAGAALLLKIDSGTGLSMLIGAQILCGIGMGIGSEQCNVAVQTVLPEHKVAKGTSFSLFVRLLGVALSAPTAQSALQSALVQKLGKSVADSVYGSGGATDIRSNLEVLFADDTPALEKAVDGVNYAITRTFMVSMILAAISIPFALMVEWKSVKKEKRTTEDKKEKGGALNSSSEGE